MKNINQITKRYFLEIIAWAESKGNLVLDDLRSRYDEDTADMFFISYFSEDVDDVLDWVETNNFFSDDEREEEKEERLATLLCKKVARDSLKWLEYRNPFNTFMREMKVGA
jgi:hypothetical protein